MNLPEPPRILHLLEAQDLSLDPANPLIHRGKEGVLNGYYRIIYGEDRYSDDIVTVSPLFFTEGLLKNGIKQGAWETTFFLVDDGLNYREFYDDGLLNGDFTVYRPDKSVYYHATFQHGTGLWKSFYPSGNIRTSYPLVRGQLQGARTEYRSDGSLKSEVVYDHGAVCNSKK